MGKLKERKDKLNRSVITSVVLHLLLIALVIWGSFVTKSGLTGGGEGGQVIDAIMVDPNAMVENFNQQQQQQANAKQAQAQREKKAKQQEEELRQKELREQERLKAIEEERLKTEQQVEDQKKQAEEQQKQAQEAVKKAKEEQKLAEEAAAKAQAEKEKVIKEQALAKKQADEKAAAQKAAEEEKAKAEKAAQEKAAKAEAAKEKAAKAEAAKEKAAKAAAKKQASEVDDLLGGLASNAPGTESGGASAAGQGGGKKSGTNSDGDMNGYIAQVRLAIQAKFYNADMYRGKTCTLEINITDKGTLISVNAVGGDDGLCQAALAAAKQARIPAPPSKSVWQQFKNTKLDFKPE
ncbi:cell envelope integrity protein TolA [Morganella morganii]|nr:cell envelope integrity protein TolA [Morganella morganii]